jgi:hypothetical protein
MAAFSSQAGQVILRTQAVQGTFQADTSTAGVGIKLRSGSLGPNRDLLIPDPEIGGGRDVVDANLGAVSWSGDYEFYLRMNSFLTLLYAAMGIKAAPVTATGVTTHTITPSDAAALPYLSIEEAIGASMETYNYTDAVVNTLHIEAEANGYLMGTASFVAAKQIAGATRTATPLFDNSPMYVGSNITLTYNSVTLKAKSFSVDINNNFEDDDFQLGSFYLNSLVPKRREITVGFTVREADISLWRSAVYGSSAAVAPGGVTNKQQLVISFLSYDDIPAGTPPTKYQATFTIPKFALKPYSLSVSGDDIIDDDIEGQALRPVAATPIMTVVAKTDATAGGGGGAVIA